MSRLDKYLPDTDVDASVQKDRGTEVFYCKGHVVEPRQLKGSELTFENYQWTRAMDPLSNPPTVTPATFWGCEPVELVRSRARVVASDILTRISAIIKIRRSNALANAINASRRILQLKENWDGEGSAPYKVETWNRATEFLRGANEWFIKTQSSELEVPSIDPGPDGGIDLHWKKKEYELLLHVPTDSKKPIAYYGDDGGKNFIKGEMTSDCPSLGMLLLWLANTR